MVTLSYNAQKSHWKAAQLEVKGVGPGVSQTWFQFLALLSDREGLPDHPGPPRKQLIMPFGAATRNRAG